MKKFRHWLIKKLGGYVDRPTVFVEHYTTPFVTVNATASVLRGEEIDKETIQWCLALELAKEIEKGSLYQIEECVNPLFHEKHYRISVRVAPHIEGGVIHNG